MFENFKSIKAISKIWAFSFWLINSKVFKILKNAKTKIPTRAQNISFRMSYVKVRATSLFEKMFTKEKKI